MPYQAFLQKWQDVEPDFVNDKGFEFRAEVGLCQYAASRIGKEYAVWLVSGPCNPTYLLTKGDLEIHEDTAYEGIACHIDIIYFSRQYDAFEKSAKELEKS